MLTPLHGLWQADIGDGRVHDMQLPGTLDENGIGHRDTAAKNVHPDATLGDSEGYDANAPIATRFTRKHTFEGEARLTRRIRYTPPTGKRIFLEAERARCLRLAVNGSEVPHFLPPSLSTPQVFEVTGLLHGDDTLTLLADNSYPGLPREDIIYSSAATDETQTNWNGVLGYLRLREEEPVFLSAVRVYPQNGALTVKAEVSAAQAYTGSLTLTSEALAGPAEKSVTLPAGQSTITMEALPLADGVRLWDEGEGNLYTLCATLTGGGEKAVRFGVRSFGDNGKGRLALNGRAIFLRSEANCAVFPETGHPPMTVEEWTEILNTYKAYGVNCMRFHSHCPPEAAFTAADELGMLMQPELSHWNPRDAFESEESYRYYKTELTQILLALANHPSFVMLTFGNELHALELGHRRMSELLEAARALDGTRLYAEGSNVHYGYFGCRQDSDFYTAQKFFRHPLRGTFAGQLGEESIGMKGYINNQYPNAQTSYDASMALLRKEYGKPVFGFEVGQFEVLPDFGELDDFNGISEPSNLRLIQARVKERGLMEEWDKYVEATGALSLIGYREESEAAMRTEAFSGLSLLGIQDFPGQGTALVGMLNSHLRPKPYPFARPEAFRAFFCDQLPLVLLPRYTYESGERLSAEVKLANYGKQAINGAPQYSLKGDGVRLTGTLGEAHCPAGALTSLGALDIPLDSVGKPTRLDLTVTIGPATNTYPVWVYPPQSPQCPAGVHEARRLDAKAKAVLARGGTVYPSPASLPETLPNSIQAQFTADFWSVGTFPAQPGGMGQLIDKDHPLFGAFPTESHTNWQWWPMAVQRAVILPRPIKAIVTEMDSYATLRPMAKLFECRCGGGRLLFSSFGLQDLQQYPEARALQAALYAYLASGQFHPTQEIPPETIATLVR